MSKLKALKDLEGINPEIEHKVRMSHMKDYKDSSSYCCGCVERTIEETKGWLKTEAIKWIKELRIKNRFDASLAFEDFFNITREDFEVNQKETKQ